MKIVQGAGALPEYFDRIGGEFYASYPPTSVSPHSETLRAVTPTTDMKMYVRSVYVSVMRLTPPTTVDRAGFYIKIGILPDSMYEMAHEFFISALKSDGVSYLLALNSVILPGTSIAIYTYDNSTGGTTRIAACISGILFE